MMERFLERLACSVHKDHFILKGGFLIASMVGLNTRATMDIDATIKGYPVNEKSIRRMISEIISVELEDGIFFTVYDINKIRDTDVYTGYRVSIFGKYERIEVPLKLDLTTGDIITPKEIYYGHKLMMEDRSIGILAYNLVTVLAEKLETIISRADENTRMRDFYDVYILYKMNSDILDIDELKQSLLQTAHHRGSSNIIRKYNDSMALIESSEKMLQQWNDYRKEYNFSKDLEFQEICTIISELLAQVHVE